MAKQVRAYGIKRDKIDIQQLALAYYLLARIRIKEQRDAAEQKAAIQRAQKRKAD